MLRTVSLWHPTTESNQISRALKDQCLFALFGKSQVSRARISAIRRLGCQLWAQVASHKHGDVKARTDAQVGHLVSTGRVKLQLGANLFASLS